MGSCIQRKSIEYEFVYFIGVLLCSEHCNQRAIGSTKKRCPPKPNMPAVNEVANVGQIARRPIRRVPTAAIAFRIAVAS